MIVLFFLLVLISQPNISDAFDYNFEGRLRSGAQYYFEAPRRYSDYDREAELRAGVLGNAWKKDDWKVDYEVTGAIRHSGGPSTQAGLDKDFDADFFRAWFRLDNDKFKFRGGRQRILFGAGALYRPLGFFDTRNISGVVPQSIGVDGVLSSWHFDESSFIEGWAVPAKKDDKVIVGFRGERLIAGWETGVAFQYHPATDQIGLPNYNLDLTQLGYHVKGEYVAGFWNESRLDIEQNGSEKPIRFDTVIGADYTFPVGAGLHALAEYFVSTRDRTFTWVDRTNQRTIHQLGFSLDQPVGIEVVWRVFGFYDIRDGSFQLAPQIEYALTNRTFVYFYGRWGGNSNGDDAIGRLFLK